MKHQCPICLSHIDNKFLYTTECCHFYHEICLLQWCKLSKTCAICRQNISVPQPNNIVKPLNEFEQFKRVCKNIFRRVLS